MIGNWESIKSNLPDVILLMEVGNYYEAYRDDAKVVEEVCGVVLSKRGEESISCLPKGSIDLHIACLIEAGYRAGIAEQIGS